MSADGAWEWIMRPFSDFSRLAVSCAGAAMLAGCAGLPTTLRPPFDGGQGDKVGGDKPYQIIYNFEGSPDGASPYATLLPVRGMLYGTTSGGGKNNKGAVFVISAPGKERVLYSFRRKPDGAVPQAGLVYAGGKLYGTTALGGTLEWRINRG